MATTIRINQDDLARFNGFIGETQSWYKKNVSQAKAFSILLSYYEHSQEHNRMITSLIDYGAYPYQESSSYGDGFNAGFEAGLWLGIGVNQDVVDTIGKENFATWVADIEDETLKQWLTSKFIDYSENENDDSN